ncbi:MAG: YmdB family metallophosphoesterase [Gemmatimonadota bacterium]
MTGAPDRLRLLFVADVFGRPGRRALEAGLEAVRARHAPALTIVNGENAAGGFGLTREIAGGLLGQADVVTSGNHIWDKREIDEVLEREPRLLRPDNYPAGNPGRGLWTGTVEGPAGPIAAAVINLQGRVFMPPLDCPFRRLDALLVLPAVQEARVIVVDFHAEATAEKLALGRYADGRVTAVLGTHTHVPTADGRILPGGTAYVTDAGMTGPHGGVIGITTSSAVERFLTQRPNRFEVATEDVRFQALLVTVDEPTGRATAIERIDEPIA